LPNSFLSEGFPNADVGVPNGVLSIDGPNEGKAPNSNGVFDIYGANEGKATNSNGAFDINDPNEGKATNSNGVFDIDDPNESQDRLVDKLFTNGSIKENPTDII
jgi:hypothetical protein